jgi:hypothetical protein
MVASPRGFEPHTLHFCLEIFFIISGDQNMLRIIHGYSTATRIFIRAEHPEPSRSEYWVHRDR